MNTGNCVFVKTERGLKNSPSKCTFCSREVFSNCIVTIQKHQKVKKYTLFPNTYRLKTLRPAAFSTLKYPRPAHFKTLWKSRSFNIPSGRLSWEATDYMYSARTESVNYELHTVNIQYFPSHKKHKHTRPIGPSICIVGINYWLTRLML
jgi:hypothetical protein